MTEKREAYVYDKTRRYEVEKGTRCTFVQLDIPWDAILKWDEIHDPAGGGRSALVHKERKRFTTQAVEAAADLWWTEYGEPVPWDLVQMLVSHTTAQVVVELRVPAR